MLKRIKSISYFVASLGSLGSWKFSSFIAPLFAIPLLYLMNLLGAINTNLVFISTLFLIVFTVIVIHFALQYEHDKQKQEQEYEYQEPYNTKARSSCIIIDKTLGYFFAFTAIPMSFKFLAVGYGLFVFFVIARPISLSFIKLPSFLVPNSISIMLDDLIAGLSINIFFLLVLWLAH